MKTILEKAFVKYKENGEYDITLESKFLTFRTKAEAKRYTKENAEKDVEYYFYKTLKDVESNSHYDVIICNDILI